MPKIKKTSIYYAVFLISLPLFLSARVVIKNADFAKRRIPDSSMTKTEKIQVERTTVNMSLIGQMTYGKTRGINSQGSIVYYAADRWVVIADYANPSKPVILSRIRVPNIIGRIRRVDNYLYVITEYELEMSIIDISDPRKPELLGSYDIGAYDIAVYGNYAYTPHNAWGMYILDISDPRNVTRIKKISSKEDITFVFIQDGYLYRNYGKNLEILSLAHPENPKVISSISTSYGIVRDILYENNILYCVAGDAGLWMIDVTDKYNPVVLSKYDDPKGWIKRVAKKDSRIYLSNYSEGVNIIDVSDPADPIEIGKINQLDYVLEVHINKDILYVGDTIDGMYVFDISNPDTLELLHNEKTYGYITDIVIKDSIAFLADKDFGVRIVDISNPKIPFEIGWFQTPGRQNEIFLKDNYLFVSDDISSLRIFDVSDINRIEEVCFIDGFQARSCTVDGNILYLSARNKGLRIFDISDIYNPVEIGHYRPESYSSIDKAIIKEPYAYLLNTLSCFIIIDIKDKKNPQFINERHFGYQVLSMDIQDEYLYLGFDLGGITIHDISDPYNIKGIGHYSRPYSMIWTLNTNERYNYFNPGFSGIEVIDLKDKTKPEFCAFYWTDSQPQNCIVKNDTVYLTDSFDGLYILKHDKTTALEQPLNILPNEFRLEQNYPNPFNSETLIKYQVAGRAHVELTAYNILGKEVKRLVEKQQTKGNYSVLWDASNTASGVYFYRLTVSNEKGTFSDIKKCILLK